MDRLCSFCVLWSSRLMAVFSDKWGYELVSLPGHRSSSSATQAVWGLVSSLPLSQVVLWLNRATGFALGVISSAYLPLGLSVAGLYSKFQVFSQLFLSGGAGVMLCNIWAMTQLSDLCVELSGPTLGNSEIFQNRVLPIVGFVGVRAML